MSNVPPSALPADIDVGGVVVALSATAANETWIKITPRGKVTTRPGETYDFDPETLAARFARDDVKLAIDLDHGIARLASQGHTVAAVGWIEEVQARTDGLYGRVDWLDTGKAILAARSHRYVSPTFHHDASNRATWLHSVALVTAPALSNMPALADASRKPANDNPFAGIFKALGLPETSAEKDAVNAIAALQAAGSPQTNDMIATLASELASERGKAREQRVTEKVETALRTGVIVPAMRDWALSVCSADEGMFDAYCEKAGKPFAHLQARSPLDGKAPERSIPRAESKDIDTVSRQLGIKPDDLA